MSEAVKKVKVKDVAKDLNISFNDVVAFLNKKGYKQVKNIMSSVDDDMMRDINAHFKKEKDSAERHQRKIAEMKETRRKTTESKTKEEEEAVAADEKKAAVPEVQEQEVVAAPSEDKPLPEPFVVIKTLQPQPTEAQEQKTEEERSSSPLETLRANRGTQMRGLTVKGKMELVKPKPVRPADKTGKPGTTAAETEEQKKKKKKKKKVGGVETKAPETESEADAKGKKKKKGKLRPYAIDQGQVDETIKRTLAELDDAVTVISSRAAHRKKRRKEREEEQTLQDEAKAFDANRIRVTEFVSVGEMANLMKVSASDVIAKCIGLGI
nr:translation initiation factor IF-2 N-terminal domain-containing protein [Bacteroidota bacterium]